MGQLGLPRAIRLGRESHELLADQSQAGRHEAMLVAERLWQ